MAICNRPYDLIYFTITFRSFTPTPGGLEFKPGQDYYFISTSSNEDLHRRVGGGCATHNMRMIFKVADNSVGPHLNLPRETTTTTTTTTTRRPINYHHHKYNTDNIYYYHPRDLIDLENNFQKKLDDFDQYENEIYRRNEALRYTSSGMSMNLSLLTGIFVIFVQLFYWKKVISISYYIHPDIKNPK